MIGMCGTKQEALFDAFCRSNDDMRLYLEDTILRLLLVPAVHGRLLLLPVDIVDALDFVLEELLLRIIMTSIVSRQE